MSMQVFKGNLYKYFVTLYRAYPRSFFVHSLLSIFSSLLFAYMLFNIVFDRELDSRFVALTGTDNYMVYTVVGVLVYVFTVNTLMNVSRSLITERRLGTLESVMMAPYNRGLYFLAYMLAQVCHQIGEMVFAIPMLLLFGVVFPAFDIFSLIVVFVVTLLAFMGLSLLLANIMLYTRDTYISQNTLFALMFLVCGVNFPVEYLPSWLVWISKFIPVTYSIELFRGVILRGLSWYEQLHTLAVMLGLGTVYLAVGFLLLRKVEKAALEHIHG